jgi:hypothetical protein
VEVVHARDDPPADGDDEVPAAQAGIQQVGV